MRKICKRFITYFLIFRVTYDDILADHLKFRLIYDHPLHGVRECDGTRLKPFLMN